ncbi:MAG: GNAT family N-acetyltransferase [bacterium]|nr:GNAT family N-acetyltransferase [bacterium]
MQVKFRIATIADLREINCLVQDAIAAMKKEQIDQWDERYPDQEILREDIEKQQLYVGYVENKIVVIYVINQEFDQEYNTGKWEYNEKPFYVLHRLCVDPKQQKQGIARSTMRHIEEELKAKGIGAMRLDVFSKNPSALRLYHSFGFKKVGHADWRKGRFYLMEKCI